MDKATAVKLLEFGENGATAICSLIEAVKQRAPGRGADFFDSGVSPIWGKFVTGLMSPAWDQHPDLAPADEIPPDGGYDPDFFNLPREAVVQAAHALTQVQALAGEVRAFLQGSDLSSDERDWFDRWLGAIEKDLDQALYSVTNQHPDFRGPEPREKIPEAPSNNEMQRTGPAQALEPRR